MSNTSDLALTREDVEKVKASAYATKDRYEAEGFTESDDMDMMIEFCDLLLGQGSSTTEDFLRGQDMEI